LISFALHDVKQRHRRSPRVHYLEARQKSDVSLHNSRPRRFLVVRRAASAVRSASSWNPSRSNGTRRLTPRVSKSNPASFGSDQAITALPFSMEPTTCS